MEVDCSKFWRGLRRSCREKIARLRTVTAQEALQWMFLKKCCCCIPRRAGVGLLMVVQLICLTPFTIHYRRDETVWIFATALIVILAVSAIGFTGALVYERPGCLPLTVYTSCGNLIFHFTMIDHRYAESPEHIQQSKNYAMILLTFNIIGIVSYFYLVFLIYTVYVKLNAPENAEIVQ